MKKVIFTESQIKKLIGENFVAYLCPTDSKISPNSYGTEVVVGDKTGKEGDEYGEHGDVGAHPTLDKIAGKMAKHGFYRNRTASRASAVAPLEESNKDFVGKKLLIPDNIICDLQNALGNATGNNGKIRITTLIKNKELTPNDAYRILNDFSDDAFKKETALPDSLMSWLKTQISTLKTSSKTRKEASRNAGVENAFLKKNEKNKGGKAHSLKTDGVSFTFEN